MKKTIFTGAAVALVTPFLEDGTVNYKKLEELIEYQIANSTDAIVACGTTGEASTLTDEEHKEVIRFTVEKVAGRIPVIAGTGSNDTAYSLELSQFAKEVGADAHLQVTPYYNKTTQKGLIKHFEYVADRVDLPMILYNVPGRTGMNILPETYGELCKHPNIVAAKEANGDVAALVKTMDICGDELDIYSGDDGLIVPMMSLGAKGVISVLSNIRPKETHEICQLFMDGKIAESAKMQKAYNNLINALFIETNPIPVKTALNVMGFEVGECRLPLCEMNEANLEKLKKYL
ncbi:MAG: 4-hydroxy-tetrahydrodipicolinate synthase [Ruminococcaceae bacterium]|nr:4-hydroxy-tetrahydrodipicolinate synthase [Oscillospiraceae bacterium]